MQSGYLLKAVLFFMLGLLGLLSKLCLLVMLLQALHDT